MDEPLRTLCLVTEANRKETKHQIVPFRSVVKFTETKSRGWLPEAGEKGK